MVNAAFFMKLGWNLIANKEALWAQVLRFKCACGNLTIPIIKCGSRASHLWRGICQVWPFVAQGIFWNIHDGHGAHFWQDPWVPGLGPLCDHSLGAISEVDWSKHVAAYSINGAWDWTALKQILPDNVCNSIASIRPPSLGVADLPIWGTFCRWLIHH